MKYLLHSKNFNYSSEKQILKNENILTETLNTSAKKKKKNPVPNVCVFVSIKILWFGNAATQGILSEQFSFSFPTMDWMP